MPGTSLRTEDPLDGLRTVHLIEDAIVQRGLRQLRGLLKDEKGRKLLDELALSAVGSLNDLDDIVASWSEERDGAPQRPIEPDAGDRAEILRSFVDLKESEAMVLRKAAREAPPALGDRLERLAAQAEGQAKRLGELGA